MRVNLSSPLLIPRNGAVLDPSTLTIQFDGYSSYLDLNIANDTGLVPSPPSNLLIPEYLQSPDPTGQLTPGWSADGWWQSLSLAHPATLFGCGEKTPSTVYTVWSGMIRESNALKSISVQV
jgi:hypothetical protein